jgi:hypothetical protein
MLLILNKSSAAILVFFINSYFHQMNNRNPVSKIDSKTQRLIIQYSTRKTGRNTIYVTLSKTRCLFSKIILLLHMAINSKITKEGLTFDDVLLVPAYSEVLPREVNIQTQLTRALKINIPLVSAAMDTVTETHLAVALAREGGIGILHKNMSIEKQAEQVRKVKRSESGLILRPQLAKPCGLCGKIRLVEFRLSIATTN